MISKLRRKPRRRIRGGATVPCPECRKKTRVLRTTRSDDRVVRERVCVDDHRFTTTETPNVAAGADE